MRKELLAIWIACCAAFLPAAETAPVKLDLEAECLLKLETVAGHIDQARKIFEKTGGKAYNKQATILDGDRTPADVVLRRTEALLNDLATKGLKGVDGYRQRIAALKQEAKGLPKAQVEWIEHQADHRGKQQTLVSQAKVKNADALMPVFRKVCALQREIALQNPLLDFDRIAFVKRRPVAMSHMCDEWYGRCSEPGGSLYILNNPWSQDATLTDLLAKTPASNGQYKGQTLEPGAYVTPEVDYDGKTIYFAYSGNKVPFSTLKNNPDKRYDWRKDYYHSPETAFHLFRIGVDGSNLTQLTEGTWNDFYPAVLPNGRICFLSERRGGEGRCHPRPCPTYVMHTMFPDGSDIVPISYHEINEWSPIVTNDGRLIYSRWDYVDRSFSKGQFPWIAMPDGREVEALYGNYEGGGGDVHADLRPVPDSPLFFGTQYGHHASQWGPLIAYDSTLIDNGKKNTWTFLTPDAGRKGEYATPYPLSETYFLCAYSPVSPYFTLNGPYLPPPVKHGVYLVDAFGNKTLLYRGNDVSCNTPYPVRVRKRPPVIPHATAVGAPKGVTPKTAQTPDKANIAVMNVYNSKLPWPDNRKITSLRIVQVLPKNTPGNGNPPIAYDRELVARQVLGTVPIEKDGSVHFTMPARVPVFFQALDENGLAIQSMRTSTYAMPGETVTCLGCHEPKGKSTSDTSAGAPLALRRAPSTIKPGPEGSKPLTFPRLVQPILDAKCVACHDKHANAPDLKAKGKEFAKMKKLAKEKGFRPNRAWTTSYNNLWPYAFAYNTRSYGAKRAWTEYNNKYRTVPGEVGAYVSKLYKLLTSGSHKDKVKLTDEEMQRIVIWLDTQSVFYGVYHDTEKQKAGKLVEPVLE